MSPQLKLYFRLLKDTRDGLDLLYDLSHDADCPHIDHLQDALVSLGRFSDLALQDILKAFPNDPDLPF